MVKKIGQMEISILPDGSGPGVQMTHRDQETDGPDGPCPGGQVIRPADPMVHWKGGDSGVD
jgi:hypothetical protein